MNISNSVVDLDPSFIQSSCPGPKPAFREISVEEYNLDCGESINKSILSWSKDISFLPPISHKLIADYLIDSTNEVDNLSKGANKHKVSGYQLRRTT